MWIYSNNTDQSDWLKIRSGHGILIYSAGQELISGADLSYYVYPMLWIRFWFNVYFTTCFKAQYLI